jgi:hypothetical protein
MRFVIACGVAVVVTDALWHHVPGMLKASTDIVGYPIFANFDFNRYFSAYELIVVVLPGVAFALFALLAWRGPLREARPALPVLPITMLDGAHDDATAATSSDPAPRPYRLASAAARLLLPTVTVALEISALRAAGQKAPSTLGLIAGLSYVVAVVGGAALASKVFESSNVGWASNISGARAAEIVRSGAALCVVPLLFVVSHSTTVTVQSDRRIVHYPWLPLWLVVIVTVGVAIWFAARVLPGRSKRAPGSTENAILLFVVGPMLVFLCVASLPGAFGLFDGFDDSQALAVVQLTFHGFFPWKDLFFIHGVLSDVFDYGVGMAVFSNSRWGAYAGSSMLVSSTTIVIFYYFTAYFSRRNRLLVLGVSLALVLGLFSGLADRFEFAPLLLILFDRVLRRRTKVWCGTFMAALVVESILTPETGLLAVGILATIVVFEWCNRTPETALKDGFFRTIWCVVFGLALSAVWVCFLATTGALSGFIDYYRLFGPGHSISGAIPTQWSLLHNPAVTVEFFLPVVLVVMTFWRAVAKLRGRRTWSTRDWTMIAAATWVLLYYGKGLGRADSGHVGETFTVTIPLLLLWVIELLGICDPFVGRALKTQRARGWVPRHLVTAVAIVAVVVAAPQWILTLNKTAVHVRAVVPTEPTVPRLGYALPSAINTTMLTDLTAVLDQYAGTKGPVFDFSNDPGVLYYLLGRTPGTRYFTVSMAIPLFAQQMLVSELEKSKPKVVVFNDVTNGLPQWDGIVNMVRHYFVSQYILDHYTPLVDVDGQLIMLRSDLVAGAAPLPNVSGTSLTSDLYFDAPTCDWGDAPNFLSVPGEPVPGSAVVVPTHVIANGFELVSGWAIDHAALAPAREVIAVSDGKVVATTVPDIARADVARALKSSGVLRSGFSLVLSRSQRPVQLYALNRDNTVTPLQLSTAVNARVITPGKAMSVQTDDGVIHRVTALSGNGNVENGYQSNDRVLKLALPSGTDLASYRWIELSSTEHLSSGPVVLTDALGAESHEISFNVLSSAGSNIAVPVGNCQQWHGYENHDLMLVTRQHGPVPTLSLSR